MFNAKGIDDGFCEGLQSAHHQAFVNAENTISATNQPPIETRARTSSVFLPSAQIVVVAGQRKKEQPLARSKLVREYPSVDSTQFVLGNPQVMPGH